MGESLRVDSAFAWPKPPRPHSVVAISAPPATMTSASPYWMVRMPRPMACVEVVQAVTTPRFGPCRPKRIDRCPEIMLMMDAGTKNGEILRGLFAFEISVVLGLDGAEAADAGAAHHAAARRIRLAEVEAGVGHRLHAGAMP